MSSANVEERLTKIELALTAMAKEFYSDAEERDDHGRFGSGGGGSEGKSTPESRDALKAMTPDGRGTKPPADAPVSDRLKAVMDKQEQAHQARLGAPKEGEHKVVTAARELGKVHNDLGSKQASRDDVLRNAASIGGSSRMPKSEADNAHNAYVNGFVNGYGG